MPGIMRDPVCGMTVRPNQGRLLQHGNVAVEFCSEYCRQKFAADPERYLAGAIRTFREETVSERRIAYFSMEIAIGRSMPTYSGGLGVLAGDHLKSCADLQVPIIGVTLVSREGYFEQHLDGQGRQTESPVPWEPERFLHQLPEQITVSIESRSVLVGAWRYDIIGKTGHVVPVILLDTDTSENSPYDRTLTDVLYGGDDRYRFSQEIVLGIGGYRMLQALGCKNAKKFHLNEGHASLLVLEALKAVTATGSTEWNFEEARDRCIFTTHTPIAAGHDQFSHEIVRPILGEAAPFEVLRMLGGQERLNMTMLALNLSNYVNGVAKRHEEVSRDLFPGYPIQHITNGVHSWTWTSDSFRTLFDRHIPGWDNDPSMLRHAIAIPPGEVWSAHMEAKTHLLRFVKEHTGLSLSAEALTIGFARRATQYKRADLILSDPDRLLRIAAPGRGLQLVFAGKAHPRDWPGKQIIERIFAASKQLGSRIPIVYLPGYDMEMARLIVAGVDLWLNTPQPPMEASGTSGMKAAHNGVPSLSALDGWWIEGRVEGSTGWSITGPADAQDLYDKLERTILPMFYSNRERWIDVMRHSIALNASFFNTHRMVQQYVTNAYLA